MQYPKISIVTPSYNQAEFIEETILSVLNQNYPNLEYVIIDGGSTDGSVEIIKKYEGHLAYWVSEPDKGHAHALNKGFQQTTGEIMAWINSDDKYFPWAFSTIAEIYAEHPDICWTTGLHANFDRRGVLMAGDSSVRAVYKNIYSYLFHDFHIQQESVFWRRSLWEDAGSYISEAVHLMVDTELWCRFFLHADLWHIDQVIGGYRSYGANRSHDPVYQARIQEDIDRSVALMAEQLPPAKRKVLDQVKQYRTQYHTNSKIAESIGKQIRGNIVLKMLPHFFYEKTCNFLYAKRLGKQAIRTMERPSDSSLVYKKLEWNNGLWTKSEVPYYLPV